jgi:hypothetical protein
VTTLVGKDELEAVDTFERRAARGRVAPKPVQEDERRPLAATHTVDLAVADGKRREP